MIFEVLLEVFRPFQAAFVVGHNFGGVQARIRSLLTPPMFLLLESYARVSGLAASACSLHILPEEMFFGDVATANSFPAPITKQSTPQRASTR